MTDDREEELEDIKLTVNGEILFQALGVLRDHLEEHNCQTCRASFDVLMRAMTNWVEGANKDGPETEDLPDPLEIFKK